MIGNSILFYSRVWPLPTAWRRFSAAERRAESMLRLRPVDCNAR
jgi:hypothetical protein